MDTKDPNTGTQPGTPVAGPGTIGAAPAAPDPKALTSTPKPVLCPHCGKALPAHILAGAAGKARIKIDGVVKTFQGSPTGAALHKMAGAIEGFPSKLKSGGTDVPNTDAPFDLQHDHEFTTK